MGTVIDDNFNITMTNISQLYDHISQIIDVMEKLHPELAETSEYKKAKAAVTTMKNNAVRIPAVNKTTLPTLNKIK